VKPGTNLSIYLDSLVAPNPHSGWMFLTNYLGHAACIVLVCLFSLRLIGLRKRDALIAAAVFGGTMATEGQFEWISFRGDMLVGLWCVLALLSLEKFFRTRSNVWLFACVTVLTFAVVTKEIALAGPMVASLYLVLRPWLMRQQGGMLEARAILEGVRENFILLCFLFVPYAVFAVMRLFVFAGGNLDTVGFDIGGPIVTLAVNAVQFALSAVFPIDRVAFRSLVLGIEQPWWVTTRTLLALGFNLAFWLGVATAIYRRRTITVAWILLGSAAVAIPLLVGVNSRYLYFSQMIMVPGSLLLLGEACRSWSAAQKWGNRIWAGVVIFAFMVGPIYTIATLAGLQPKLTELNSLSMAYERVINRALEDPRVKRIFLINDPSYGGGRQKLRFHQLLAGRDDVSVRMVNRLEGHDGRRTGEGEGVFFEESPGSSLRVTVRCGETEAFFGALVREQVLRLGVPGLIEYGEFKEFERRVSGAVRLADKEITFLIPDANRRDLVVIGLDPGSVGIYQYGPVATKWMVADSIPGLR
jgi:hypothetical protein